ncbi:MAG: GNAT family N-acetyltransferase [Candidatus Heimdallarchaeota archaeon]
MASILENRSLTGLSLALEANLIGQVRYYGQSPIIKVFDEHKMVRVVSGVPVSIFNLIAGAQLEETNIEYQIEEALEPFNRYQVPMIWWVGPMTTPKELGTHLETQGLAKIFDMPGMYYELASLEHQLQLPPHFRFEHVTSDDLLRVWAETQTKAFGVASSETQMIYEFEKSLGVRREAPWLRYIGFCNEEPVGVSILFFHAGVAAIFNVATIPEYRRQGIGQLMTKIPLFRARRLGYKFGVLKASKMGQHLYSSMDFAEICKISYYYYDPRG